MPEDKTTPAPQDATLNGADPTPATGTPQNGATPNAKPTTIEEALARIEQLERHASNKEEQATRHGKALSTVEHELAAYKEKERLAEEARLPDAEKQALAAKKLQEQLANLQKERDDATTRYQEYRITTELERAARRIGATNENHIADAIKLIDRSELDFGEDGTPTNAEKLLKKFAESHSWLTETRSTLTSGGATNPSRTQISTTTPLSWDIISKMNAEEYKARRQEITQWMAANPAPR